MSEPGRILLTGATGHLGAAVAAEFLSRHGPSRLRVLIRSPQKLLRLSSAAPNLAALADCESVVGDIRDSETLAKALDGADAVIHACHSHEYWRGTGHIVSVSLDGARGLAEAAAAEAGVRDLVYIGSYSAHDHAASALGREALGSRSARAASSAVKATAQQVLRAGADAGGYRLHVVSPSYMLGPYQLDPTYFGALFHLVRFRPLTWHPPHGINLVDVRDVARCVIDCLTAGNGNAHPVLASGDDVPFLDVFTAMNRAAGHDVVPKEISPTLLRRLPRLRFFGDFGKHYFDKPHYVGRSGLTDRSYSLAETIADTVTFATCIELYCSPLHIAVSLARRYL